VSVPDRQDGQAAAPGPPPASATPPPPPATPVERATGAWFRAGFFAGLGLILAWALANAVWSVRDVLVRVLIAGFLAVSLDPAVRWLMARGVRRGLAVTVILVVFLGVIAGFLMSVIPPLVDQVDALVRDAPDYIARLQRQSARFRELDERFDLTSRLEGMARGLPAALGGGLLGFVRGLFGALANFLTVVVFMIYFMLGLPRLRRGLARLMPVARRGRFQAVADVVIDKVGAYMIGQLLTASVAGVCAFVAMALLGVAFPIPLAMMVGITALIPLIGATIGAVGAVAVTIFTSGLWPTAVLLGVFFLVYQQVENYLIAPRIQRSAVNLSAVAVLTAGLIGATALGLLGALMAIPVAAAIKVVVLERIHEQERAAAAAS
jgi:predicted PurR-regulated permease PerM